MPNSLHVPNAMSLYEVDLACMSLMASAAMILCASGV